MSVSIEHWTQRNLIDACSQPLRKFRGHVLLHSVRFMTQDRVDLHLDLRTEDSQPSASVEFSGNMQRDVRQRLFRHVINRNKWNTGEAILDGWKWPAGHEKLCTSPECVKALEECLDIFTFVKGIHDDQGLLHKQSCSARHESGELLDVVPCGTTPFFRVDKVIDQASGIDVTPMKLM